jgi:tetratricopeptide (TPR) repeat protein
MRAAESISRWALPAFGALVVLLIGLHPEADIVPARINLAQAAVRRGLPGEALSELEAALEFEPALAALHPAAAELALLSDLPARALAHVDAADALLPPDPERLCLRVEALHQQGEFPATALLGSDIRSSCQAELPLLHRWVDRLWEAHRYRDALSLLDELEAAGESTILELRQQALAASVYRPASAAAALRRALAGASAPNALLEALAEIQVPQGDESMAPYYASVGGELARHGQWGLAQEALQAALAEEPNLAIARAYLGMAIEQLRGDGWPQIWGAVLTDPSSSAVWTVLGGFWLERDDVERALSAYQQAERLDPGNAAAAAGLGGALTSAGRINEAAEAYLRAARNGKEDPALWILLARFSLAWDFDVISVGLPAARNAVAISTSNPEALASLGYAHVLAGEPLLGRRLLLRAIDLSPSDPQVWYQLGLAYLALGDAAGARPPLQQAYSLDPDGPAGLLAQRTLESLAP